jgi:Coenzyme PQQ synthesis protein D (PqqD)
MPAGPSLSESTLLESGVRVPDHVVRTTVAGDTVIVNLETAQYHGLNPVAGEMLDALDRASTVSHALADLRGTFPDAADQVRADLCDLCRELSRRGLIELEPQRES